MRNLSTRIVVIGGIFLGLLSLLICVYGILLYKVISSVATDRKEIITVFTGGFSPINSLFSALSLVVFALGFILTLAVFEADHARRKKEATIKAVVELDSFLNGGFEVFGPDYWMQKKEIDMTGLSNKQIAFLHDALSKMTFFANAIETNIFDKQVASLTFGYSLKHLFDWMKPFVDKTRKEYDWNQLYFAAEKLSEGFYQQWKEKFSTVINPKDRFDGAELKH